MNNLILIKNGQYAGQTVMANPVNAQDGLRYQFVIEGKTFALPPNQVSVLPESHPKYRKLAAAENPDPVPSKLTENQIDEALRTISCIIGNAKVSEQPVPGPVQENEADQLPPVEIVVIPVPEPPLEPVKEPEPAPELEVKAETVEAVPEPPKEPKKIGRPRKPGPLIKAMDIVIDFDGTVVTHDFPKIGQDIGAVPVLRDLVHQGHRLILFTMRSDIKSPVSNEPDIHCQGGGYLSSAVQWFKDNGIPLHGIQTNPNQKTWTSSPKAYGQIIIDDAAIGCPLQYDRELSRRPFVDWAKVRNMLVRMNVLSRFPVSPF